jgi:hypothetical protein
MVNVKMVLPVWSLDSIELLAWLNEIKVNVKRLFKQILIVFQLLTVYDYRILVPTQKGHYVGAPFRAFKIWNCDGLSVRLLFISGVFTRFSSLSHASDLRLPTHNNVPEHELSLAKVGHFLHRLGLPVCELAAYCYIITTLRVSKLFSVKLNDLGVFLLC